MLHFEMDYQKRVYLVLFLGKLDYFKDSLSDEIERVYEQYHRPDTVVLIFPDSDLNYYTEEIAGDKKFDTNIRRYGEKVLVSVMTFDVSGTLKLQSESFDESPEALTRLRDFLVEFGLKFIANKNGVIEQSPPGYAFLKPSQNQHTDFIAAHRLAQSHSENDFLSFSILSKIENIHQYEFVYVDTSAINYVVLALVNIVNRLDTELRFFPVFKSFHSYKGLISLKPKPSKKVLVIISASTSNNMAKLIESEWPAKTTASDIVTLLSFTADDRVLCCLKSPSKPLNEHIETYVRRVDEYFTAEHLPPKSVVLKQFHGKNLHSWPFVDLYDTKSLTCNRSKGSELQEKEMTLDLMALPHKVTKDISDWWEELIDWHIPTTIKYVVVDKSDSYSKPYIEKVESACSQSLEVLDINEIIGFDFNGSKKAVLVLIPVIGSGNVFISINRDLRLSGHDGIRVFTTFFHLHKSSIGLETFTKSLLYGPAFKKYRFFSKFSLNAPFRNGKSSWELERDLYQKRPEYTEDELFSSRLAVLEQAGQGLDGRIGINGRIHDAKLSFTRHFAFWNFEYNESEISPEAVYFSVASILQEARDNANLKSEDSLASRPHQQALLSPENFVRFNDPLLQSCLWRAAKGCEMDYSSDETISNQFVDVMERLSRTCDGEKGEAFVDLLIGLAVKKICISKSSLSRLLGIVELVADQKCTNTLRAVHKILTLELTTI